MVLICNSKAVCLGKLNGLLYVLGPGVTGLLKQMVCICKWSFGHVPLYIGFHDIRMSS